MSRTRRYKVAHVHDHVEPGARERAIRGRARGERNGIWAGGAASASVIPALATLSGNKLEIPRPSFKFGFDEDAREKARLQTLVAGAVWRPGYGGEGADMPRDLGALTPASFRDYVRFNSIETVLMHFRKLDADGSGEMTVKEFREGVTKLGFTATKQDAALVFKWLDHDGSGVVPFIELDKKLREHPVEMQDLLPPPPPPPPPPAVVADPEPEAAPALATRHAAPKRCTCEPLAGRVCIVLPAPLWLRASSSFDSVRVG
jgi:hypothetical protein